MAKQTIVQTDTFGEGFTKANDNFSELYLGANDNVTSERFPVKIATTFIDGPLYWDQSENKIVSDITFEVPGGTVKIGEITNISSSTGQIIIENEVSGALSYGAFSIFDTSGSAKPCYLGLGAEYTLPIQTGFLEVFSSNPLNFSLTGTVTLPDVRQVNAVTLKTGAILTNFRARFTDNATGSVLRYLPSKAEWDAGTGLTTASGDNFFDFINTGTDTPGTYYLGIHPFIIENGQQIDIQFRADSMNILGELFPTPLPYLILEVQDGPFLYVVAEDVNGNVTTSGSLDVQGNLNVDGTITSTSTENLLVSDDFIHLNFGYETIIATEGGLIHNYLPTSVNEAIDDGTFTPGVAGVSNPTVTTAGTDLFAAADIVMISNTSENDGIYEVLSHTSNVLTVKGVGLTATVEAFSNDQFIANALDDGNIRKINVTVIQSDTSGNWQTGKGNVTGITYNNLTTGPASSVTNSLAFYTDTTGQTLDDTTNITYSGTSLDFADNTTINIGTGNDFQISHDGSITTLFEITQGDLKIQNTDTNGDIYIQLPTTTETDRFFVENSASDTVFYVDGAKQAAIPGDLVIGREAAATSVLHVYENTTATDTTAGVRIENAGTGDALLRFVADGQTVSAGIDNSATNTFKLSMGDNFNANVAITIDSLENISTGGNVGINKFPASFYPLDVKTFASETVRLRDDKAITFEAGNYGTYSSDFYFNRGDVGTNQSEFVMYNIDDNFFAERFFKLAYTGTAGGLTIQNTTNNVGIGVDLPDSPLHVYEDTATTGAETGLTIEQDGAGDALIHLIRTGLQSWTFGIDATDANGFIISRGNDLTTNIALEIDTSDSITTYGLLGVNGTPAANHILDVTTTAGKVVRLRTDKAVTLEAGNFGNTNTTDMFFNRGDVGFNQSEFALYNQNNATAANRYFHLGYTDDDEATDGLSIRYGGDVGVGVALPDARLHVAGDAIIEGTVYPDRVYGYIKNGETGFAERHISTGVFSSSTILLAPTGNIYGAWWGKEGTRLYITTDAAYIYQYDLTVPYDISTATIAASNNFTDPNNTNGYTLFNNDGTVFYHGGRGSRTITLTTPWEISGIASDAIFTTSFRNPFDMWDLRWNSDGTKVLGVGYSLDQLQDQSFIEWECTTPYDFTTKTATDANIYTFPTGVPDTANIVKGFDISPDGKRVYLSAPSTGIEYEVVLETAWDLSSSTLVDTITRGTYSDILNYSMAPDASGMVSVTAAGLIVQKKYGLAVNGYNVTTEADDLNTNTGWLEGGSLSINGGDNTLVDVTAGKARICDYTDRLNPVHTIISWAAQTIDPTLDTNWNKWVGVQESATPGIGEFVFDVEFTQLEKRSIAIIGRVWGITATGVVVGTGDYATPGFDQGNFGSDLSYALGSFNKEGNVYSANGANLTLDKTAGKSFRFAANVAASPLAPHNIVDASQTAISSYYYILSSSTSADIQIDIDPDNYDLAGSKTAVPTDKYTLQRLYYYPVSQVLTVSYGQEVFNTMTAAIGAAGEDIVDIEQSLIEGSVLRGWIALKQGATALNDSSQALFKSAQNLNEPGAIGAVGTEFRERSFTIADVGASGNHWFAGFYRAPAASTTLTIGGTTTQTYGTAGRAVGAHAFVVFGGTGDGSLVLTVSGTSITDDGVRTPGDSEDIYSGISAVNDYWETTRKWLGQITYTLTGTTGSYVFNYGFAKYEDFSNTDFTVTDFEVTGRGGANETDLDIILYYHSSLGWTYSAGAFVPGGNTICKLSTDYSTDNNLATGLDFAYKRTNLSTAVAGSSLEGVLVNVITAVNNSIESGSIHIGVLQ